MTTPSGTSISPIDFVVDPGIKLFSPSSGSAGTIVVITGWGLNGATLVQFNGVAARFVVNSVNQITAVVPAGATTGPIRIVTPSGTVTSSSSFAIVPQNVSTQVHVTGSGLLAVDGGYGGQGPQHFWQFVTVQNVDSTTLVGPLLLVLNNLTPGAVLTNAHGTTQSAPPLGSPWINLTLWHNNALRPGDQRWCCSSSVPPPQI